MTRRDLFWRIAGAALIGAGYVLSHLATEAGADLVGIVGLVLAQPARDTLRSKFAVSIFFGAPSKEITPSWVCAYGASDSSSERNAIVRPSGEAVGRV